MRNLGEVGICPQCQCSLTMYKTSNYKRFVKCDVCEISYPLPKRGKLNNSALTCPKSNFPVFTVERKNQQAYFWADRPCFTCVDIDRCEVIQALINEFKELKVYGY